MACCCWLLLACWRPARWPPTTEPRRHRRQRPAHADPRQRGDGRAGHRAVARSSPAASQEPRREWSEAARRLYPAAVQRRLAAAGTRQTARLRRSRRPAAGIAPRPDPALERGGVDQRARLHHARQPAGDQARQAAGLDARPGVEELRKATGADYALFTYIRDSYTSGGRKALRIAGLLLLGGDIGGGRAGRRHHAGGPAHRPGGVVQLPGQADRRPARRGRRAPTRRDACSRGCRCDAPRSLRALSLALAPASARAALRRRRDRHADAPDQRPAARHRRGRALVRDGSRRARTAAVAAAGARSGAQRLRAHGAVQGDAATTAATCACTSSTCPGSTPRWRRTA